MRRSGLVLGLVLAALALPACDIGKGIFQCSLQVATSSVPDGRVGERYVADLEAVSYLCEGFPRWRLKSGPLPPGVELAPSGRLTGVPTQVGTFPCVFEVYVEDAVRQLSAIIVILAGEEVT